LNLHVLAPFVVRGPQARAARFTWDHTGFAGVGGFIVSRVLNRARRRMLDEGLPVVLGELDDHARWRKRAK
jgi:hypothetical protein